MGDETTGLKHGGAYILATPKRTKRQYAALRAEVKVSSTSRWYVLLVAMTRLVINNNHDDNNNIRKNMITITVIRY